MKKYLGAAVVGAVMTFSGAAFAGNHGVGDNPMPNHHDHFPSFEYYYNSNYHGGDNSHGNQDYGSHDGNGGNDFVPPDHNVGDTDGSQTDGCRPPPPPCGGGDPHISVVPLPQSSALAATGLLSTVLFGWVRSRRAVRA